MVQILATVGGLMIGAALVTSIRDTRFRHSAIVLLVGYAAFGLSAAVTEHRIELATDFPSIAALRRDRELADIIAAVALAGVRWLYRRRVARFDARLTSSSFTAGRLTRQGVGCYARASPCILRSPIRPRCYRDPRRSRR